MCNLCVIVLCLLSFVPRTLLKTIIQFYTIITDVIFIFSVVKPPEVKKFCLSALCGALCRCLDVAGSPDYYDLSVLEEALKCVVNLTSR